MRSRQFDANRSFVERAVSFPENIEVEATHTFTTPPELQNQQQQGPPTPQQAANAIRPGSATRRHALQHGEAAREADDAATVRRARRLLQRRADGLRAGRTSRPAASLHHALAARKKDPNAAISEPVKPIVYYIDPATPTKWVPYLKRGVESWQPAFEAAGFSNAIIAKRSAEPLSRIRTGALKTRVIR